MRSSRLLRGADDHGVEDAVGWQRSDFVGLCGVYRWPLASDSFSARRFANYWPRSIE